MLYQKQSLNTKTTMCMFFVLANKGLCLSLIHQHGRCVCVYVTCRWPTCHFKALARCESTGTGYTGTHSGSYPHSSVVLFTHYTCRNIMTGAHYNAVNHAPAPCLHLWSYFDGSTYSSHFAPVFK